MSARKMWREPKSTDLIDFYGDRQICDTCGASISTYGDKCNARLDVRCAGFNTYEMMLSAIKEARERPQ